MHVEIFTYIVQYCQLMKVSSKVLLLVVQEDLRLHHHFLHCVQKVRIIETLVKVVRLSDALVVRISGVGGVHLLLCLLGQLLQRCHKLLVVRLPSLHTILPCLLGQHFLLVDVEHVVFLQVLQIRLVGFAELPLALSPDVVSVAGEVEVAVVLEAVAVGAVVGVAAAGGSELRGESLPAGELTSGATAEETTVEARGAGIVDTPLKQKIFSRREKYIIMHPPSEAVGARGEAARAGLAKAGHGGVSSHHLRTNHVPLE